MSIEVKNSFLAGLDLDTSPFQLRKDAYIDALNVTRDAVAGNQDMVITNIVGNRIVSYSYPSRTIYISDDSFFVGRLLNNGDGTQTMTLIFGTIGVGVTNVNLEYYDGSDWTAIEGSTTSPQTYEMPEGAYTYRVVTVSGGGDAVYMLSTSSVSGTGKVIGAYPNTLRNTVIFMRYDSELCHGIYEYNRTTGAITKILQNLTDSNNVDILGFTENEKITSVGIYNRDEGDLLFYVDSLGRPTSFNITEVRNGTYTPITREIIDTIKEPPLNPPTYVYGNDTTHRSNNLLNTFFRFKHKWIYDDNEESSWSPISQVNIPTQILDDTYTNVITNNNIITVSVASGAKNVKYIALAMSYAHKANEWSDFSLVEYIDKAELSIADNSQYGYSFYNDSAYPLLDKVDSDALFYYVPDRANAMILANGNTLVYGGITEGYDRTLTPNVDITVNTFPVSGSSGVGNLTGVSTVYSTGLFAPYTEIATFVGSPAVGTIVTIKVKKDDGSIIVASTYTTVAGDTAASVAAGIVANESAVNLTMQQINVNVVVTAQKNTYQPISPNHILQIEITPPSVSSNSESLATWKWSTSRRIGIAYYDKHGKTNGVLYDAKVVFPAYSENVSYEVILPYINVKIYHTPPAWAYSYQFVITKEPTTYLFWETVSVNTTEADYLYFEVTNLTTNATKNPTTANVLSYSFQDGDRVRLIKRTSDQTVYADTYDTNILGLLNEPTINGVVQTGKQFLKIKNIAPFSSVDYSSNVFVIEIYRPARKIGDKENEVFYEFGQQFKITNPTTSLRAHSGTITNQDVALAIPAETDIYYGDSYFRQRTIYLTTSGVGVFYCQDRNIVDIYMSAVSSIDGRPSAIDIHAKRQYFGNLIRFGQSYQANTNINGLNTFYAADFEEVDYSLGSVRRFSTRERYIRVFQDYKIGMMPLFSQINKSTSGDVIVQTDRLLNPIQYYVGNFGIGTASESLYSFNNADYGVDNNRGVFWRVSNDGVTPISILYKVNSWATDNLPSRTGNYKVYGGFDPKANNYIAALEATEDSDAYTISFDEQSNVFESFLSYHPEMMVTLGTLLVSFKNGNLYTHDNSSYNTFYGTTYESYVVVVFNEKGLEKKTWMNVNEVASEKWDCPLIYSNVMSYGTQRQETNLIEGELQALESNFTAAIKRDIWSRGGKINGAFMKGNYLAVKFRKQNATNLITLNLISAKFIDSPLST